MSAPTQAGVAASAAGGGRRARRRRPGRAAARTRPSPGRTSCAAGDDARSPRAPKIAGTMVIANEPPPGSSAGVEAEAAEHQRAHVDAVEQDDEGGHARGDVARLHAGAAHRPRGQRDAAGAGAREQPRRGVAGEGDLVLARRPMREPRAVEPRRRGRGRRGRGRRAPRARARARASAPSPCCEPLPDVGQVGEGGRDAARARRACSGGARDQEQRLAQQRCRRGTGCPRRSRTALTGAADGHDVTVSDARTSPLRGGVPRLTECG